MVIASPCLQYPARLGGLCNDLSLLLQLICTWGYPARLGGLCNDLSLSLGVVLVQLVERYKVMALACRLCRMRRADDAQKGLLGFKLGCQWQAPATPRTERSSGRIAAIAAVTSRRRFECN